MVFSLFQCGLNFLVDMMNKPHAAFDPVRSTRGIAGAPAAWMIVFRRIPFIGRF
jgi:hypothetical protein